MHVVKIVSETVLVPVTVQSLGCEGVLVHFTYFKLIIKTQFYLKQVFINQKVSFVTLNRLLELLLYWVLHAIPPKYWFLHNSTPLSEALSSLLMERLS